LKGVVFLGLVDLVGLAAVEVIEAVAVDIVAELVDVEGTLVEGVTEVSVLGELLVCGVVVVLVLVVVVVAEVLVDVVVVDFSVVVDAVVVVLVVVDGGDNDVLNVVGVGIGGTVTLAHF